MSRNFTPFDAGDLDRQIFYETKAIRISDVFNIPIVIESFTEIDTKFYKLDSKGEPVIDKAGNKVKLPTVAVSVTPLYPDAPGLPDKLKGGVKSFTTQSEGIIHQLKEYSQYFMRNNVPKEFRKVMGVIAQVGREYRILTTREAMRKPVEEHGDAFKSLEEAGSPIKPENCKYGSTRDQETLDHEKDDDKFTLLLGDPNDLSNDTTLPEKTRRKYKKIQKRIENEDSD